MSKWMRHEGEDGHSVWDDKGMRVCHVGAGSFDRDNANLIAAAPDLLHACQTYLRNMEQYGHQDKADRLMMSAIKKALAN